MNQNYKKIISFILCICTLVSIMAFFPANTVNAMSENVKFTNISEYVASTTYLNIRKEPSVKSDKLGIISTGSQIIRIGIGNNGWSKIIYKGKIAYVDNRYIKSANYQASKDVSGTKFSNVNFQLTNENIQTTTGVNIRTGPGLSNKIITTLKKDTELVRIGIGNNGWSMAIYDNKIVYISSQYVVKITEKEDDTQSETNEVKTEIVKAKSTVNIRTGPSTIYKKLGSLKTGDFIVRTEKLSNGWSKVVYNGNNAYIKTSYLTVVQPNETTVYATDNVNIRTGPSTRYQKIGVLKKDSSIISIGVEKNGWHKVIYQNNIAYISGNYLTTTIPNTNASTTYPLTYSDATCTITIYREWYKNAWVYAAHITFTDYSRLSTDCANGKYNNGYETTSHAAKRLNAIFAVNGCYSAPYLDYTVVRGGKICNGATRNLWVPAIYSANNGLLLSAWETGGTKGIAGVNTQKLVDDGLVTDTFCFGPPGLIEGKVQGKNEGARAQRTFIGTNGKPGDIWICVSDGRYNDGESTANN